MAIAVDALDRVLDSTWQAIRAAYDVTAYRPDLECLFAECDLTDSIDAAECVVLNMLVEVMENVGRFSPWYTMPARAFGVMHLYKGGRVRWLLAPDAVQRWQAQLRELSVAIRYNIAVLEAELLVGSLLARARSNEPCVRASCRCSPQRSILINRAAFESTEIVCSECYERFHRVA